MPNPNCECCVCGKPLYRVPSVLCKSKFIACKEHQGEARIGRTRRGNKKKTIDKDKEADLKRRRKRKQLSRIKATPNTFCSVCGKPIYRENDTLKSSKYFACKNCLPKAQSGRKYLASKTTKEKLSLALKEHFKKNPESIRRGETSPSYKVTSICRNRCNCIPAYTEMTCSDGKVFNYRLIVALAIGRPLKENECVHHHDGNPRNNNLSNLALFNSQSEHMLYHSYGKPLPIWSGRNNTNKKANND